MCTSPCKVFKTGLKTDTGKDLLYFDSRYPSPDMISLDLAEKQLGLKLPYNPEFMHMDNHHVYLDKWLKVPCGKCAECKMDHARDWSYRVLMEVATSSKPCHFLTLTYALPVKPNKKDLQAFMKRLRKRLGNGIRFFACGERGEKNKRFHYHVILFNCDLKDLYLVDSVNRLYASDVVSECWPYGIHVIGEVTTKSAAYVARYTNKKTEDEMGFINMSRRPGIGYNFLASRKWCFDLDYIPMLLDGELHRLTPPRYMEKIFPDIDLSTQKARRIENAERVIRIECAVHQLSPYHLDEYKRSLAKDHLRRLERNL